MWILISEPSFVSTFGKRDKPISWNKMCLGEKMIITSLESKNIILCQIKKLFLHRQISYEWICGFDLNDHVTYQLKFYLPTSHLTNNGGDPFSENTPFLYQSFLWSEFLSSSPDVHFCYLSCTLAMECLSHRYHQTTTQPFGPPTIGRITSCKFAL